jgi:Copper transport outer membrane protein, MctB
VIDFRYHLVSIVAVFLALAIGIVLGSTELQGHTIDVLQSTSTSLSNRLNAANAQHAGDQAAINADQQFLQTAESRLLDKQLDGDRLVIITEPGAPGSVIDGIKQAAGTAGATVTGVVALQPKFNDLSGATQSNLSTINSTLASTDHTVLAAAADPRTAYQQQAAQLIATAILAKTPTPSGAATSGSAASGSAASGSASALSAADAQTLLAAYEQGGYLTVTPATMPATLAVIITPQAAPTDGQNDPGNQVLLALAEQFANGSAATLVVGSADGSSPAGSAISMLRSSSVSGQVSSVDDADTTLGQISSIWALANTIAGRKPNSYGISGASAVSPVPLPEVTAAPTISPTPHKTAKGKGTKSVKKK